MSLWEAVESAGGERSGAGRADRPEGVRRRTGAAGWQGAPGGGRRMGRRSREAQGAPQGAEGGRGGGVFHINMGIYRQTRPEAPGEPHSRAGTARDARTPCQTSGGGRTAPESARSEPPGRLQCGYILTIWLQPRPGRAARLPEIPNLLQKLAGNIVRKFIKNLCIFHEN